MPFLSENSPYWRVKRTLPGYGPTGKLSTRTKSKARAEEMERLIERLAERGWHDLIDAVRAGDIDLPALLKASHENRLHELRERIDDPKLSTPVQKCAYVFYAA